MTLTPEQREAALAAWNRGLHATTLIEPNDEMWVRLDAVFSAGMRDAQADAPAPLLADAPPNSPCRKGPCVLRGCDWPACSINSAAPARDALDVRAWAVERLANSERIAATKSGEDRDGWLEDVAYWRAIATAVARRQPAHDPLIAELQTRYTAAQGVPVEGHPDHPAVRAWDTAIWRAFPKIAAALAQRDVPRERNRSFWVCERFENGKSAGYWDGGSSRSFVPDIDKAIQFCRKEDVFWVTGGWHWKDTKQTEHLYIAAAPQERSDAQRDDDARDAARYRWVRTLYHSETLDEAIDAAMQDARQTGNESNATCDPSHSKQTAGEKHE